MSALTSLRAIHAVMEPMVALPRGASVGEVETWERLLGRLLPRISRLAPSGEAISALRDALAEARRVYAALPALNCPVFLELCQRIETILPLLEEMISDRPDSTGIVFSRGDRVRTRISAEVYPWQGFIVGDYLASGAVSGYVVERESAPGILLMLPASDLELVPGLASSQPRS